MNITDDRKDLFTALAKAQECFTTVEKNAVNPHFRSKFAPLDSIIEMIRPILPKFGLSFMQHCDIADGGIIVETVIAHESGQYVSSRLYMPSTKIDPQGYGSALSYGKRYGLGAALGIVSDEDVDGNSGEAGKDKGQREKPPQKSSSEASRYISDKQRSKLFATLKESGVSAEEFKTHFAIASSSEFPADRFNEALEWLEERKAMQG